MRAWMLAVVLALVVVGPACKGLTGGDCQRLASGARPILTRVREHLVGVARALPTQDFERGEAEARKYADLLAGDLAALDQVDPKHEPLLAAWRGLTGQLVEIRMVLGNIAAAYKSLHLDATDTRAGDELRVQLDNLRSAFTDYARAGKQFDALCR